MLHLWTKIDSLPQCEITQLKKILKINFFRGSANIGFGDFGSVGASADLQVPGDINFLSTIIYGLGGIVLVNTIVSIATALWPKGDATEEATEPEEQARRMKQIMDVGQQVFHGIKNVAEKYNQH